MLSFGSYAGTLDDGKKELDAGKFDKALALFFQTLNDDPKHAEATFQIGLVHHQQGRKDLAIQWLKDATELNNTDSRFFQRLGEAYGNKISDVGMLKQMSMAKKIRRSFEKAIDLDPDNTDARFGLITFHLEAPGIAGGSKDKALIQAQEIEKRNPPLGAVAQARVYRAKQDFDAAENGYRRAMSLDPKNVSYPLALGAFLTDQKRIDEAIEVFDSWLTHKPNEFLVHYQIGRTASISGQYLDRGKTGLEQYLTTTPKLSQPGLDWAHYRLGLIHRHLNDIEAARQSFGKALAINDDHKLAKKALKEL